MILVRLFAVVAALTLFSLSLLWGVRIVGTQFVQDMVNLHGGAIAGVPVEAPAPDIEWENRRISWRGTLAVGSDIQAGSLVVDFVPGTWRQWILSQEDKPVLEVTSLAFGEVRAALDLDRRGANLEALAKRMRQSSVAAAAQRISVQDIALHDVEVFAREYHEARSGEVFPVGSFAVIPPEREAAPPALLMSALLEEVGGRSVNEALALGLLAQPENAPQRATGRPRESSAPVRRKESAGKKAARAVSDFFNKLK